MFRLVATSGWSGPRAFSEWRATACKGFGLGVFALILVQDSQIVQAVRDIRVVRAEGFSRMASDRLYRGSASAYLP